MLSVSSTNQSRRFSILVLEHENDRGADASRRHNKYLMRRPPASYRTESDDLATPARHVAVCVDKELDLGCFSVAGDEGFISLYLTIAYILSLANP